MIWGQNPFVYSSLCKLAILNSFMDHVLIGVQEKWRGLLLSSDEWTQVSRCCVSGKFKILSGELSGKCQGILFPPECGNPADRDRLDFTGIVFRLLIACPPQESSFPRCMVQTCPCNLAPLEPQFYIVTLRFTGA